MRRLASIVVSLMLGGATCAHADAPKEGVEADASTRQVAITSSFTGTEILVFGAVTNSVQPSPEAGTYDVIVVVEGVPAAVVIRKKTRAGGIWLNTQSMQFASVPSYYAIASTRPVDEIAEKAVLDAHGVGFGHVQMDAIKSTNSAAKDPAALQNFKDALIRLKKQEHVYVESEFGVSFIGSSLFRATIALPPNVPVGPLTAHVYLFKDGLMLGEYSSRVMLQREGIERYIHETAISQPLIYGILTVLVAAGSGLAAAFAFRKPA
jgi:uncharacterized protein (TIGR02186 family)